MARVSRSYSPPARSYSPPPRPAPSRPSQSGAPSRPSAPAPARTVSAPGGVKTSTAAYGTPAPTAKLSAASPHAKSNSGNGNKGVFDVNFTVGIGPVLTIGFLISTDLKDGGVYIGTGGGVMIGGSAGYSPSGTVSNGTSYNVSAGLGPVSGTLSSPIPNGGATATGGISVGAKAGVSATVTKVYQLW